MQGVCQNNVPIAVVWFMVSGLSMTSKIAFEAGLVGKPDVHTGLIEAFDRQRIRVVIRRHLAL
jgi:hypothetical protein